MVAVVVVDIDLLGPSEASADLIMPPPPPGGDGSGGMVPPKPKPIKIDPSSAFVVSQNTTALGGVGISIHSEILGTTEANCLQICWGNTQCMSFVFQEDNGSCWLFQSDQGTTSAYGKKYGKRRSNSI